MLERLHFSLCFAFSCRSYLYPEQPNSFSFFRIPAGYCALQFELAPTLAFLEAYSKLSISFLALLDPHSDFVGVKQLAESFLLFHTEPRSSFCYSLVDSKTHFSFSVLSFYRDLFVLMTFYCLHLFNSKGTSAFCGKEVFDLAIFFSFPLLNGILAAASYQNFFYSSSLAFSCSWEVIKD